MLGENIQNSQPLITILVSIAGVFVMALVAATTYFIKQLLNEIHAMKKTLIELNTSFAVFMSKDNEREKRIDSLEKDFHDINEKFIAIQNRLLNIELRREIGNTKK